MAESHSLTGYGPSHNLGRYSRLVFDGHERRYEQWEVKFLGKTESYPFGTRKWVRRITENHSFTENHRKPLRKSYL